MLPDARNPHPLTDPIHLPSPRMLETPVVLPDPPIGCFPIPTVMTLVSTTVVQMYGGLTIQALDVIAGADAGIGSGYPQGLTLALPTLDSLVSRQGGPRTLTTELVSCFSTKWNQSLWSLGFSIALSQRESTACGTQGPVFGPFPHM